jgi:glucokinase
VAAVGIGAAGFVDASRSTVMFSPHLAWRDEPLRARVSSRLTIPVVVDNDANTTALGESRFGAGVGHRFVLCITLGTGIGGAIVIDGRVYRGANGMAGEFGHMQVVPDGRPCECGGQGCWEQYCSGRAVARAATKAGSALAGPELTAAAQAGDPVAVAAYAEVGRWLGVGVANVVAGLDPALVVVGGGVSAAGDLLLDPARTAMAESLVGAGHRVLPDLLGAELGPLAGVVGVADLARPQS